MKCPFCKGQLPKPKDIEETWQTIYCSCHQYQVELWDRLAQYEEFDVFEEYKHYTVRLDHLLKITIVYIWERTTGDEFKIELLRFSHLISIPDEATLLKKIKLWIAFS